MIKTAVAFTVRTIRCALPVIDDVLVVACAYPHHT